MRKQKLIQINNMLTAKTKICLVVGWPIDHSLSPAMHNAAYKALGMEDEFVFLGANVQETDVEGMIKAMRILGIRGYACTMPHKLKILEYLNEIDPIAKQIGAVNTVVNENGFLKGYNTDWLGVVTPLKKLTNLNGKKVAIIGAGGAARAVVYGLLKQGADISVIFNRELSQAEELAKNFNVDCSIKGLEEIEQISGVDIIVNATPLGMRGELEGQTPLPKEFIKPGQIIFDVVYSLQDTRLLREAKEQGAKVVSGVEMVLYQAIDQFAFHAGCKLTDESRIKVEQAMRGAINNILLCKNQE